MHKIACLQRGTETPIPQIPGILWIVFSSLKLLKCWSHWKATASNCSYIISLIWNVMLSSWVVLSSAIVNLYIKVLISLKPKERALLEGFSTNARPSWGHNCLVLLDFHLWYCCHKHMVKRAQKIQKMVKKLHQRFARNKQFAPEWGLIMKTRKVLGNIPILEGVNNVSNLLLPDVQISHECLVNTMSAIQQGHVLCHWLCSFCTIVLQAKIIRRRGRHWRSINFYSSPL